MDQYEYVRIAHRVYGKSIRQLHRETGHSRNTIRKVLKGELGDYSRRETQPYPVLGSYLSVIDQWLEEDKARPKKQRHTAKRIYDRLVREHGFKGSESTVRRYVREAKVRMGLGRSQVFIPLDPECAQEAEIDWGAATVLLCGESVRIKFFCMRSKYSGKHFVRLYPCERQQALFDAHIRAFEFFGGIFPVLIYDNLTTAVQKVLRGKKRVEQESFRRFHAYYNFTPRFCNPAQGHEKGGVEGMIGYVRRNYLVPIPQGASLDELNRKILKECLAYGGHRLCGREQSVNELFEEERTRLIAVPKIPFSNLQVGEGKVDPYATVRVDKNRYSTPSQYGGLKVRVELFVDRVDMFYASKQIASHPRLYGNNKWCLDPDHYLELIQQRPQAFHSARPIRQWRAKWPVCLEQLLERFKTGQGETRGIKDFICVLFLYRDHRREDVQAAVELALETGISSSEGVRHILLHTKPDQGSTPLDGWPATLAPDISAYGQLGGVR